MKKAAPTIPLTDEQQKLCEEHVEFVKKIVYEMFNHRRFSANIEKDYLLSAGYLALIKATKTWDKKRPFKAYLATAIHNEVSQELRRIDPVTHWYREKVKAGEMEAVQFFPIEAAEDLLALDTAHYFEDIEETKDLFSILTPKERECVFQYYGEEKDQPAIAREMGISKQAVSYNIKSGIKRLQKELNIDIPIKRQRNVQKTCN